MRISDWSSDVCSSDLEGERRETCPDHPPRAGIAIDLGQHVADDVADRKEQHPGAERPLAAIGHRDIAGLRRADDIRSEEHTSELQSLMRISYAVFCLKHTKSFMTKQ